MTQSANLLSGLLSNSSLIEQLSGQFGISADQARGAIEAMAPALARGVERETEQPGGVDSLLNALQSGNHQRYVDDPAVLTQPGSVDDGNAILGHILGSKDVSRNVAAFASDKTGLSSTILKAMLPMLAGAVMGMIAKQMRGGGGGQAAAPGGQTSGGGQTGGGGLMDVLGGFLDTNKDGSMMDELLSMATDFMKSKR